MAGQIHRYDMAVLTPVLIAEGGQWLQVRSVRKGENEIGGD